MMIADAHVILFDGEIGVINYTAGTIDCKGVRINLALLLEFRRTMKPIDVGYKLSDGKPCGAWIDDTHVHVGCLKESITDFNAKYIRLIKHLNKLKNERSAGNED